MTLMLVLIWIAWRNVLPLVLRFYELVGRLWGAPIVFKQVLLSFIQLIRATFPASAYSMGHQLRVDELQVYESLQTTTLTEFSSSLEEIQETLVGTAQRERLLPSQMIINAAEVALSESNVISQTPDADIYRGMIGRKPFTFKRFRIPSRSQHPDRRDALIKAMINYIMVSSRLQHPRIVLFEGVHQINGDIERTYLILPPYDTIMQYLSRMRDANRRSLLRDVAEGLAYLHDLNIVHGGVKDEAILVDGSGMACLSDFSQAYTEGSQFTSTAYTQSMTSSLENIVLQAPELLDGLAKDAPIAPTRATDVYALGCLVYQILVGKYPFEELMNCRQAMAVYKIINAVVSEQKSPAKPNAEDDAFIKHGLTEEIWSMIETCWNCDSHLRPDARAVGRILTPDDFAEAGQNGGE